MISCFVISFDQTLKSSGIGNYLETAYPEVGDKVDVQYDRLIFDNIEFLLITLLMLAIISGIIIDKFGELRTRREEYLTDHLASCFICGKTRKELDQEQDNPSFNFHVKFQHNLWDYVYFIANLWQLKEKNVEDITYIEKYVMDKLDKNDYSWFPSYA